MVWGDRRASSADIDLGTRTPAHRELLIGPMRFASGLWDRAMVGTYTLPWAVALVRRFSVVPNGFAKVDWGRWGRYSASTELAGFYVRLNDLDKDRLNTRAVVIPAQLDLGLHWGWRWDTTVELTGVWVRATGSRLMDQDTVVEGVALAQTVHIGVVQRFQWRPGLAFWLRGRYILGHAPARVDAETELSDEADLRVRARANSAELSSAGSAMVGILWTWRATNLRLGVGYGHWILPWIQLPVGRNLPTADLSVYWRF